MTIKQKLYNLIEMKCHWTNTFDTSLIRSFLNPTFAIFLRRVFGRIEILITSYTRILRAQLYSTHIMEYYLSFSEQNLTSWFSKRQKFAVLIVLRKFHANFFNSSQCKAAISIQLQISAKEQLIVNLKYQIILWMAT